MITEDRLKEIEYHFANDLTWEQDKNYVAELIAEIRRLQPKPNTCGTCEKFYSTCIHIKYPVDDDDKRNSSDDKCEDFDLKE